MFSFWLFLFSLFSVSAQAQEHAPIDLIHADQVSLERTERGNTYFAHGDVHFRQGKAELYAQRAIWYEVTGEVHLFGNVKVLDTTGALSTDTLRYYGADDRAFAYGHVVYERPGAKLVAYGDRGEYDRGGGWAKLYQNAHMTYRSEDSSARIDTWADTLHFASDADSGRAIGNVRVARSDGTAAADEALFVSRPDAERLLLWGNPEGTFGANHVSGDTLILDIRNDRIDELHALGNARASFQETSGLTGRTTESELASQRMLLDFADGELRELVASGQAKSGYVPAWGVEGERNDASGDTVKISLADSTVQRVQVVGGAEGRYHTPRGTEEGSVDTISYSSDYIDYRVDQGWIRLYDHADVSYGEINLTAGQVVYQTLDAVMRAYTLDDTLLAPPADYEAQAVKRDQTDSVLAELGLEAPPRAAEPEPSGPAGRQTPVLRDRSQEVRGSRLVYDIRTRRGRILQSFTETPDGYYRGGNLRKESDDIFYVENGRYTTCENNEDPHFEFSGRKMKMVKGDRVVTRPVVLRIEGLPVLWVPYYVFSIKPDRHSGLLPVRFGNFERGSRYVRNIGYYFALSDYWDVAPAMDIIENEGILWHVRASYGLRYKLGGAVFASYNKHTRVTSAGEQVTKRWNLLFNHTQQLSPTATLSGQGNFVSDNSFYQDFTADPSFRLDRLLRSQINLNKRWTTSSLILALEDNRNLDDDSRTSILPRVAFSLPTRQLFSPRKLKGGRMEDPHWYHNLRIGYTGVSQNYSRSDTLLLTNDPSYVTADHRVDLSYTGNMGPFTLTPRVNVQETWYWIFNPSSGTLPASIEANTPYRRMAGSFSISSQANIFGFFPVNSGGLVAFRHVFTPSLSFSMAPAVTRHNDVRLYTGVGGGGARSRVLGIGMANVFQMKTRSGDKEKNWDILNLNSSTSYNFEAPQRKFGNITTSIRSGLLRNPDISLNMVHDPYDPVTGNLDWSPRLANVATNIRLTLSGQGGLQQTGAAQQGIYQTQSGADFATGSTGGFAGPSGARSWSYTANYNFSETRRVDVVDSQPVTTKSITHWFQQSLRFNPSRNWQVETNLYYDINTRQLNDWTIRLHRDLHCWEANFSWVVTGPRAGYYFNIHVKRLSDLKLEKSEGGLRDSFLNAIPGT